MNKEKCIFNNCITNNYEYKSYFNEFNKEIDSHKTKTRKTQPEIKSKKFEVIDDKLLKIVKDIPTINIQANQKSYICFLHKSLIKNYENIQNFCLQYKDNEENILPLSMKDKDQEIKTLEIINQIYEITKYDRFLLKAFIKSKVNLIKVLMGILSSSKLINKKLFQYKFNFKSDLENLSLMVLNNILKENDIFNLMLNGFEEKIIYNTLFGSYCCNSYLCEDLKSVLNPQRTESSNKSEDKFDKEIVVLLMKNSINMNYYLYVLSKLLEIKINYSNEEQFKVNNFLTSTKNLNETRQKLKKNKLQSLISNYFIVDDDNFLELSISKSLSMIDSIKVFYLKIIENKEINSVFSQSEAKFLLVTNIDSLISFIFSCFLSEFCIDLKEYIISSILKKDLFEFLISIKDDLNGKTTTQNIILLLNSILDYVVDRYFSKTKLSVICELNDIAKLYFTSIKTNSKILSDKINNILNCLYEVSSRVKALDVGNVSLTEIS